MAFRIVATDMRAARDGKYLECLGWYDPQRSGENFKIDVERIAYWRQRGAQISDTVRSLLRRAKKAAAPAAQ